MFWMPVFSEIINILPFVNGKILLWSRKSAGDVRSFAVLAVGGPGHPRPGHHDLSGSVPLNSLENM